MSNGLNQEPIKLPIGVKEDTSQFKAFTWPVQALLGLDIITLVKLPPELGEYVRSLQSKPNLSAA